MALTKRQEELIGAYGAIEAAKTPFWKLFEESKKPYLAISNVIRVDEVLSGMQKAGIIPRGTTIPSLSVNGHSTVSIKPYIVAGSVGLSALDSINKEAGDVVVLNGQKIRAKDYDKIQKLQEIKSSIENTKEEMAASVFLTGKVKGAKEGETINLELRSVESKTKGKTAWVTFLASLVTAYYSKNKKYPEKVLIGSEVANSIITEINFYENHGFTSKVELTDTGLKIALTGFPIPIETFPSNDLGEDTSSKITMYRKDCLVPIYAGLEYVGTTNESEMTRADVILDTELPNRETGQSKLFGKSAPFPLVILPDLFMRFNVTDVK